MNWAMLMYTNKFKSYCSVIAAALLFGTAGTAQQFAPEGAQMEMIGATRLAVGAALLLIVALSQRQITLAMMRDWTWVAWASAGVAAFNIFYFSAIDLLGVAVGTTIMLGSTPVFTGALGYLVHGEVVRKNWYVSTTIAVAGATVLTLQNNDASVGAHGFLKAIGAGFSYAFYSVMVKGLVLKHAPVAVMSVISSLGFLLLTPLVVSENLDWLSEASGVSVVLYLGIFATAIPYFLLAFGLKSVPVAHVSTLVLAEPIFATLLGVYVLGEILTLRDMGGIVLILSGISFLSLSQLIKKPVANPSLASNS